jgi:hypothetical protein
MSPEPSYPISRFSKNQFFNSFSMGIVLYFGGHTHSHSHGHTASVANSSRSRTSTLNSVHSLENADTPHSDHKEANINVRAAFIHVLGDLVQSVGVLIAAVLILVDVYEFWIFVGK